MPISHGHPPQEPQPVPATTQACHASGLSRSPNSPTPPPGILGRMSSHPPPQAISWPLEEVVDLWYQFWRSFQVKIQESLFIFFGFQTPSGRVIFKVRGMGLLQLHLVAPPLPSPRSPSVAILASGVGLGL